MRNQSQRNFAHVTTVTLSWRVQNFVVIGRVNFKPEHCKFWSNFEFDRNIISGTGARVLIATEIIALPGLLKYFCAINSHFGSNLTFGLVRQGLIDFLYKIWCKKCEILFRYHMLWPLWDSGEWSQFLWSGLNPGCSLIIGLVIWGGFVQHRFKW